MFTVFHNSTTAYADEVMDNFYHIFDGDRLPRSGDALAPTNNVYDIGSSTYKWNQLHCGNIDVNSISSANKTIWKYLYSVIVSAPAQSIEITGLNGDNERDYLLEFHLVDNTTTSISLIFNGDSAASYGVQCTGSLLERNSGTSISFCRASRNDTSTSIYCSTWATLKAPTGYPKSLHKIEMNSARASNINRIYSESCVWTGTATLTSMKFIASGTNGINAGTVVTVFGRG